MTPEAYLERVRALLPVLRERTAQAEGLRRLPDETFADFQEAGLFRALQPKRYGGYELDPGTFYQAVMEVGTVCGSSAWILGVIGVHNWHLAILPPQAQEDVWGADNRPRWRRPGRSNGSRTAIASAAAGPFPVVAISATGSYWAGSRRRPRTVSRRTRASFWCRAVTTSSTTTGT